MNDIGHNGNNQNSLGDLCQKRKLELTTQTNLWTIGHFLSINNSGLTNNHDKSCWWVVGKPQVNKQMKYLS